MPKINNGKNGATKQPAEQKPKSSSAFPAPQKDTGLPKTKYEEEQDDEILALESIFADDFERVDIEGAGVWKVLRSLFCSHLHYADQIAETPALLQDSYQKHR